LAVIPPCGCVRARASHRNRPAGHPRAHRNKIRDIVWDAINHEITDILPAQEILDDLHERFVESDRYDAFLYRPLRESVEAICKDLGLSPDWSRWTDDGFPPDTRASRYDWKSCWRYDAKRVEAHRQSRAESEAARSPPPGVAVGHPLIRSMGIWSGRRDSNSRPQPWQGCALPLSYARAPRVARGAPKSGGRLIAEAPGLGKGAD
jgi:hypothetical protein